MLSFWHEIRICSNRFRLKDMKLVYKFYYTAIAAATIFLGACSNGDGPDRPPVVEPESVTRAIIVYAVNNSSLYGDFNDDAVEMINGISTIADSHNQLIVYKTDADRQSAGLYLVQPCDRQLDADRAEDVALVDDYFKLIKSYDLQQLTVESDRMAEVIEQALGMYPNATYDLILWGHGSAWQYSGNTSPDKVILKSFGGEYDGTNKRKQYWMNIDAMADAIPDHRFNTIWFDSCLMSSIEVIYQLRDKCRTFVGYASEVYGGGMDYSRILPQLLSGNRNLVGAARSFFDSYNDFGLAVTVAVLDMNHIERLAEVSAEILRNRDILPDKTDLTNYSRPILKMAVDFYDFKQYFTQIATLNNSADAPELTRQLGLALNELVIYHAASEKNFSGYVWDAANLSCVSTHLYDGADNEQNRYYRTLDWFKRVYE